MFAGFRSFTIDTSENTIHGVTAGDGPAVLLLHGIPQTHLLWRFVAPILAKDFTVVAADLRGYGDSGCTVHEDPRRHSMRELAAEQAELMALLGHERFAVVGHDRGARCAYRLALDFPDVVTAVSVLDIVPTADAFDRADARFALDYWLWSFLAAPAPIPETLIAGAPGVVVDHLLEAWSGPGYTLEPEVRSAYRRQFSNVERVATICQQYRAAATIDREHDATDMQGRKIQAPLQVLWSRNGAVDSWYDPIEMWRQWAVSVDGQAIDCGHFLPEERPDETSRALHAFLRTSST